MLATEAAGGFTGVYFALYATGNGRACAAPARFADINRKNMHLEAEPHPLPIPG